MSKNNTALATKSTELAELLQSATEPTLRNAALKTAAKALYLTRPASKVIDTALEYANAEDFDHPEIIEQLRTLADEIERPYEAALDAAKPVHEDTKLMALFAQARAVIALSLAIDKDISTQAGNAVYEALCAGVSEEDAKRYIAQAK